jgi:hypothetical protein
LGEIDLKPWLNWYTPVNPLDPTDPGQDQFYTPGELARPLAHGQPLRPEPLHQPAYDAAYDVGYAAGRAGFWRTSTKTPTTRCTPRSTLRGTRNTSAKLAASSATPTTPGWRCREWAAAAAAPPLPSKPAKRPGTPEAIAAAQAAAQARLSRALAAVANIPQTIEFSQEVPDFGCIRDGYWTTTTSGQWVASPGDVAGLPTAGQLAYLAYAVEHGDLSALAPVMNWTAYLTNVNLIAYGDGAIATGLAYQAFIDSVKGNPHEGYNPFVIGDPETGPRQIRITFGDGVVTVDQTDTTNNPSRYRYRTTSSSRTRHRWDGKPSKRAASST